jgi:hypothetical protein
MLNENRRVAMLLQERSRKGIVLGMLLYSLALCGIPPASGEQRAARACLAVIDPPVRDGSG